MTLGSLEPARFALSGLVAAAVLAAGCGPCFSTYVEYEKRVLLMPEEVEGSFDLAALCELRCGPDNLECDLVDTSEGPALDCIHGTSLGGDCGAGRFPPNMRRRPIPSDATAGEHLSRIAAGEAAGVRAV